ncbi:PhoD-like phosphatase family protein [Sphingomonas sp. RIT328]|nr:PhoD-like phosphatase family protein [Sphingomonas sp. RIT328]
MTDTIGSRLLLNRRTMIGAAAAMIGAPAILRAQQLFTAYPFRLGIAAGDPAADGFVIWTRLAPDPLAEHGGMPMQPVEVSGRSRPIRALRRWSPAARRSRVLNSPIRSMSRSLACFPIAPIGTVS